MLADTERGLSGTQIERLLQEIEVADTSPGITKWKRLFNALAGAQNRHQIGNHLIMFINRAMNPVNYARDPATFTWRRDELNVVLAFSGFYVREDGKVGHADKATTLDAARARAGRLKAALESRVVHAEVLNYCRAELLDENYFHAVFEATKGVAERIRLLSGLNGDGADLVSKAFAGQQIARIPEPTYVVAGYRAVDANGVRIMQQTVWLQGFAGAIVQRPQHGFRYAIEFDGFHGHANFRT